MAQLKQLKDYTTNEKIYPITHVNAVFNDDGDTVQEIIDNKSPLVVHLSYINDDLIADKTFNEISTALSNDRDVIVWYEQEYFVPQYFDLDEIYFSCPVLDIYEARILRCTNQNNGVWEDTTYTYQPQLNSGENIKTVNGQSVMGSGNISIAEEELREKAYAPLDYSGLGRKYLQKNMVEGVNIMTQAMFQDASENALTNTVFVVQYDYDLDGETITMPAGATLKFEGGSLKNGTITGNGTTIVAGNVKIFDDVTFSGSFTGSLNALWIGAKSKDNTFDNSPILQAWFSSYSAYFRVIEFPLDNYYFLTPCVKNDTNRYREIRGNNSVFYVNIADLNGEGQYFLNIQGENFSMRDVRIINARKTTVDNVNYDLTKTRCLLLNQAQLFSLSDVTISYFDVGVHIIDVWYGGFSGINGLVSNRIGVLAEGITSNEVNTVDFRNIRLRGVPVATAQAVWPQDDGESDSAYAMRTASVGLDFHVLTNNCKFDAITIEGFDYGIRFNYKEYASNANQSGVASITKCYFEANRTFDIYKGIGWVIKRSGYSGYLYNHMDLLIESCLFHTLKKLYFTDADVTMLSCHETCDITMDIGNSGCSLVHDGCANSNSYFSTRIYPDNQFWQNNGSKTAYLTTLRAKLESYEASRNMMAPYASAQRLSATYNSSIRGDTIGAPVRHSFEMYPTVGMQDIIQPLRCYYDAQKNSLKVEITSGGEKRLASAEYSETMRTLSTTEGGIPLFEFLRRWDAGISYTGKVSHLFPYSIVATPATGLITTSSGNIVGFGKKAILDNTFVPSSNGHWIDVDSMCRVDYSFSYLKLCADLVQCGRNYNDILPDTNSTSNPPSGKRYYGSSNNRQNVTRYTNAIYLNTDTGNYEIYTGTKWVTLTSRYQRYEYVARGASLAERATMADFPGQTYTDESTGITYVFKTNATKTSWSWMSISDKVGTTTDRPQLSWNEDGFKYYDTTIKRNIYAKIGKSAVITQVVNAGSQSTATVVTISNTLTEGARYWCGYSTKQSWGGSITLRRTSDSSAGQITLLSNFNSNDKGTFFVAPSPEDFPYIRITNNYGAAETITFEEPATSWIEDDGATAGVLRSGTTANRPASTDIYAGFVYYDTDLGANVVWDGNTWVTQQKERTVRQETVSSNTVSFTLDATKYHTCSAAVNSITVTLPATYTAADVFSFSFTCNTSSCVLTLPSGVVLGNGQNFLVDRLAGRKFQVTISDGIALYCYADIS